jgi:glycosyltransferase involved in cell wall biosynthesis
MILSILICSLKSRAALLKRLQDRLAPQLTPDVEVIVKTDGGQMPIGRKRNALLDEAKGDYICFVDDDDLVSEDYVALILAACACRPDVVSFNLQHLLNGNHIGDTEHSLRHEIWINDTSVFPHKYYRCPNHLNPVRRDLALKVRFPEKNTLEDKEYSIKLRPMLKTEVMIQKQIYYYMEVSK